MVQAEVDALRREAELDRSDVSPAQPTGSDRIDDDGGPSTRTEPHTAHVKPDHAGKMEN